LGDSKKKSKKNWPGYKAIKPGYSSSAKICLHLTSDQGLEQKDSAQLCKCSLSPRVASIYYPKIFGAPDQGLEQKAMSERLKGCRA
jgi:hypothetical protein